MPSFTTDTCFTEGCDAPLTPAPGNYYCEACIAKQQSAQDAEREAFDADLAYADAVAKRTV